MESEHGQEIILWLVIDQGFWWMLGIMAFFYVSVVAILEYGHQKDLGTWEKMRQNGFFDLSVSCIGLIAIVVMILSFYVVGFTEIFDSGISLLVFAVATWFLIHLAYNSGKDFFYTEESGVGTECEAKDTYACAISCILGGIAIAVIVPLVWLNKIIQRLPRKLAI